MLILSLLMLFSMFLSGITTIPFFLGLLVVATVVFKKSWVFFLALILGLFLDLVMVRSLGQTGLFLILFTFLLFLYERKFETRTFPFVFISTFLGSMTYLMIFGYQNVVLQSLANSLLAVLLFKISGRLLFLIPDS